jgi:type I restriction enzyme, S subunit
MNSFIETEIGTVPSEWAVGTLGDICEFITDGAHQSPKAVKSNYFMPSVKDMRYNYFDLTESKTISEKDYQNLIAAKCSPANGDIVLSKDGANCLDIIFVYRQPEKIVLLSSIAIARLKSEYCPDFYMYYLLSPNAQDIMRNNYVSGSAIPRVILKDFKNVPVPLLPLSEQIDISNLLKSLDDKIDLLHHQSATLEKMAEILFRQWFVEEAKDNWEVSTLQKHVDALRGLSYKGSGLANLGSGLPMHNLNSIFEGGGYKSAGIKYYSGEYRERHLAFPGDIIVANTEQGHEFKLIGFPAVISASFGEKGLFSQHIYKLVGKSDSYLSRQFIYYLLMDASVREQITAATNGSTVNMLAIDGLQRPEFRLPPEQLVNEFTQIISANWDKKQKNEKQIRTLTALRDTLLPKLMSGEIRVATEDD